VTKLSLNKSITLPQLEERLWLDNPNLMAYQVKLKVSNLIASKGYIATVRAIFGDGVVK